MSGIINECFIDSSVLIEYIKGTQTELLELIFTSKTDNYINHIVYSEFIYHFLSVMSGISPLRLKTSSLISEILEEHDPLEFIHNFKILDMDEEIINKSNFFMINYNLLPNDALIFATCRIYDIKYLVSFDIDFQEICEKQKIVLINSTEKFKEIVGEDTQETEEVEDVDNGDE